MSGSSFDDIDMSGWRVNDVNLAGAAFSNCRIDGMTIEGILVSDLLQAYRAAGKRTSGG
jgi:hypothetical protein